MGFVKNIKSKLEEHFIPDEREYDENDVEYDEEYEEENDAYYEQEEESSAFEYESPITPPEYVKYGESAPKQKKAEKKTYEQQSGRQQPKSNIYNMGNARENTNKFKLNFIALHDIYDAKNVANIMIDQNAMVVVNLGLLSDEQKRRAMDFLDGAKYVTNSIFTRFTENICAFLPESVELHGDFYGQVDLDDFGNF
ncbi:MAG: DUF552 domain-containing protein [Ruminococcaceae bacterium]|nr:DUF552 domain-containing protein [Oscillospiraceae bacterium]MBQ9912762.1 cell division protein SepF [Clostridia bacterium]